MTNNEITIVHPYLEGLVVVGLLCALFAIGTIVAWGLAAAGWLSTGWVIVGSIFVAFWLLLLITIWVWGIIKRWQIRNFLHSNRSLIHWFYTPEEWAMIQAEHEQEQTEGQLLLAPGCLAALFALVGLLVGSMVGADEGAAEAVLGGGVGLLIGAAVGGSMGATVAGGNVLAYRWLRHHDQQRYVALGPTDILYGRSYFHSNGVTHFIENVTLQEAPPLLLVTLCNPKPRGDNTEIWAIPVPQRVVESLRAVLLETDFLHTQKR